MLEAAMPWEFRRAGEGRSTPQASIGLAAGSDGGEGAVGRRPYIRPRIVFREPLEAVAVACVPTVTQGGIGKPDISLCIQANS
jgi:hypothetical protein